MEWLVIVAILLLLFGSGWYLTWAERKFNRELAQRTSQSPDEFASFYATACERSIALRLLPIYSRFFGIEPGKLRPLDRPPIIVEIDHVKLIADIETEFGVSVSDREAERIDGSFDSIVQFLARKCPPQSESAV